MVLGEEAAGGGSPAEGALARGGPTGGGLFREKVGVAREGLSSPPGGLFVFPEEGTEGAAAEPPLMEMCLRRKKKQYLSPKDSMAKPSGVLQFLSKTDLAQLTTNSLLTKLSLLSEMLQKKRL